MLVIQPRFWAEEGVVYFKYALDSPIWDALIAPHQGYYSLFANLSGVLASLAPLEYAPFVTMILSLSVILGVLALIMFGMSGFFITSLEKSAAAISVVLVGSMGEIWLNTINSQFYLVIFMFLILVDEKNNNVKAYLYYALAGFIGLSSIMACFIAPLFLVRYFLLKKRQDLIIFFVVATATGIQLGAILYSQIILGESAYFHAASQARLPEKINPAKVADKIISYTLIYPISYNLPKVMEVLFGTLFAVLMIISVRNNAKKYWAPIAAIWILSILSVLSSIGMNGGGRYAYATSVISCFFLISLASDTSQKTAIRSLSGFLISISLMVWLFHYKSGISCCYDKQWPIWSEEVYQWRTDPSRPLRMHPQWEHQTKKGLVWSIYIDP